MMWRKRVGIGEERPRWACSGRSGRFGGTFEDGTGGGMTRRVKHIPRNMFSVPGWGGRPREGAEHQRKGLKWIVRHILGLWVEECEGVGWVAVARTEKVSKNE